MRRPPGPSRGRSLWYLCLELATEGQASHTHVTGILRGLASRGWEATLWQPANRRGPRGAVRRMVDMAVLQARLMTRRSRPDVLYIRGHFASLPAVLWARIRRVPVVWESNGALTDVLSSWPQMRPFLPLLKASSVWQLRLSAAVISVTPELARSAARAGARRNHVVSNGADTELFVPTAAGPLVPARQFVSFTGTLATWQGIDALLAAVDDPAWPAGVSLVVIGDGVRAEDVRERAVKDQRVRYLGRLPHREVPAIVARSLCAASPKSGRAHATTGVVPLKLFEAMACGVPVIVSALPGQADIVREHCCGVVVPPDDPGAIATAVAMLDGDRALARGMGERARAAAVERYSWDAAAALTDRILADVARS